MGKLIVGVNDLATVHPELLDEWDYEKNNMLGIYPDRIAYGSGKKVWWKCSTCGHEWQSIINNRSKGRSCPICTNQQVLVGYNDLATLNPDLVKEWNYKKNGSLLPTQVTCGTNKKVWWKCSVCGNEWQAFIHSRTNGTGCPKCGVLRRAKFRSIPKEGNSLFDKYPNLAIEWNYEKNIDIFPSQVTPFSHRTVWWKCSKGHEWQAIISTRTKGNGCPICSNQKVFVGYNDFATLKPDLVKEWNYNKNVILPTEVHVGSNKRVWWKCSTCGHEWQARIDYRNKGSDCPICSNRQVLAGYNDLKTTYPEIAKEWNYKKNGSLLPTDVIANSSKRVWWVCNKGHEWQSTVSNRINGNGCPICSGKKVLQGYNDLATINPKLAKEWNYEKNDNLLPTQVSCGSNKKVWWKCSKGHEWEASIVSRNNGVCCPVCANNQILAGYNDLATLNPDLAKEWNYEKNGDLLPTMVTCGSSKKVWWKCNKGHEWQCRINHRNNNIGCPYCSGRYVITGFNDLQTINPDLAKEWNHEKNGDLLPTMVMAGSHKKVWWKCNKGHEWQTSISNRVKNRGCPICSNKKVLAGYNDLATLNPDLVKEWNYEKNGDLLPTMVTCSSGKKVWWKCDKGHEWQAIISNRKKGVGCPKCVADKQTSFPEQAIYYFLNMYFSGEVKNRFKELKDERGFIEADIYLPKQKIVIEYDGAYWHKNKQEKDLEKEFRVKAMGNNFIRIVEHNKNKVIDNCILYNCRKNRDDNLTWAICELFSMLNISNLFVNVSVFRDKILEFCHTNEIKNSFAIINPDLAKEWNYEKNGSLKPTMFTCGSNEKVWWKCSKGHEWKASIDSRTTFGIGCPICANRIALSGYNDLATLKPDLVKEWNYEKNDKLLPTQVTCGTRRKVWWKCSKGHEWQASISERCHGTNCPVCANRVVLTGFNDLATLNPDLAKEWNYEKNGSLLPTQVIAGSVKKVWWKCNKGHEWRAIVRSRVRGNGCPECAKMKRKKK